jgi:hypothetical protein
VKRFTPLPTAIWLIRFSPIIGLAANIRLNFGALFKYLFFSKSFEPLAAPLAKGSNVMKKPPPGSMLMGIESLFATLKIVEP